MAMQQLTLPGKIVKKDNELVRSRVSITSVQGSRILAALIASINNDEKEFKNEYTLNLKAFLPNDSGKSYTEIKSVCRELSKAFVEFETEKKDGDFELVEYPFFSQLKYKKGFVYALFNPIMSNSLLELKSHFTKYNLIDYLKLPSIYSQRIFEILKSYESQQEVTLTLKSFHETINTPESFRADFAAFRRRVLEKAHKDITERTSFSFEWEPIKEGRSVIAVHFIFGKKRALPLFKPQPTPEAQKKSEEVIKATEIAQVCRKEHGPTCTGGHQNKKICKLCVTFYPRA